MMDEFINQYNTFLQNTMEKCKTEKRPSTPDERKQLQEYMRTAAEGIKPMIKLNSMCLMDEAYKGVKTDDDLNTEEHWLEVMKAMEACCDEVLENYNTLGFENPEAAKWDFKMFKGKISVVIEDDEPVDDDFDYAEDIQYYEDEFYNLLDKYGIDAEI